MLLLSTPLCGTEEPSSLIPRLAKYAQRGFLLGGLLRPCLQTRLVGLRSLHPRNGPC